MSEFAASYLVWFGAAMFAAASALTIIRTVNHLDPPEETRPDVRKAA